jgi:hypothetical protein
MKIGDLVKGAYREQNLPEIGIVIDTTSGVAKVCWLKEERLILWYAKTRLEVISESR